MGFFANNWRRLLSADIMMVAMATFLAWKTHNDYDPVEDLRRAEEGEPQGVAWAMGGVIALSYSICLCTAALLFGVVVALKQQDSKH